MNVTITQPARPNPPLTLEEAQRCLIAIAPALPIEHRATAQCAGFYLARPVSAQRTQPAAAVSAMDGYAMRAADLPGPWAVIGESAAGNPFAGTVTAGEAVRISTGALVPPGADMVLIQEDAAREDDGLRLTGPPPVPPARHIRPKGMDFIEGATLMAAGMRIGPAQIALALTADLSHLAVRRPLNLIVIDSGDELADPGQALAYKTGELKIKELRNKYQKKLGRKFNIKSFHDAILLGGAMPLNLLEIYMDEWAKR